MCFAGEPFLPFRSRCVTTGWAWRFAHWHRRSATTDAAARRFRQHACAHMAAPFRHRLFLDARGFLKSGRSSWQLRGAWT